MHITFVSNLFELKNHFEWYSQFATITSDYLYWIYLQKTRCHLYHLESIWLRFENVQLIAPVPPVMHTKKERKFLLCSKINLYLQPKRLVGRQIRLYNKFQLFTNLNNMR